jgi:hypothetical protein
LYASLLAKLVLFARAPSVDRADPKYLSPPLAPAPGIDPADLASFAAAGLAKFPRPGCCPPTRAGRAGAAPPLT